MTGSQRDGGAARLGKVLDRAKRKTLHFRRKVLRILGYERSVLPADFDEQSYRCLNPDVEAAIVRGEVTSGQDHYLAYGALEARPYLIPGGASVPSDFDEEIYLQMNPDVREAVGNGSARSGLAHFLGVGRKEGRKWQVSQAMRDLEARVTGIETRVRLADEALASEARRVELALSACKELRQRIIADQPGD